MDGPSELKVPSMIMTSSWRFTPGSIRADGKRGSQSQDGMQLEGDCEYKSEVVIKSGKNEKDLEECEWLPPTVESLKAYVPVHWRTLECANCRYKLQKLPSNRQPVLIYMGKERKDINDQEERYPVYLCAGECAKRYIVDRIELDNHKLLPRLDAHLRDDHGYTDLIAIAPQPILLEGVWPGPNPMTIDQYRAQFQSPYITVLQLKPFVFEESVIARIPKDVYREPTMTAATPQVKTPVDPSISTSTGSSSSSTSTEKRGRVYSTSFTSFSATKLLSSSYPRMQLPSS